MHPDRIAPTCRYASAPSECANAARVVGLGAPVSVRIRLEPSERPALRRQITRHMPPAPPCDGVRIPPIDDDPQAPAWREMLAELDKARDGAPIVVLWPTALATPALRGALTAILDAIADSPRGAGDLTALADRLATATALLDTLRAVLAVDHGGLQDVDL
jgi:hypothetical protein